MGLGDRDYMQADYRKGRRKSTLPLMVRVRFWLWRLIKGRRQK